MLPINAGRFLFLNVIFFDFGCYVGRSIRVNFGLRGGRNGAALVLAADIAEQKLRNGLNERFIVAPGHEPPDSKFFKMVTARCSGMEGVLDLAHRIVVDSIGKSDDSFTLSGITLTHAGDSFSI